MYLAVLTNLAQVQSSTVLAVGIMIGLPRWVPASVWPSWLASSWNRLRASRN